MRSLFPKNALLIALICSIFYVSACQSAPVPSELLIRAQTLDEELRRAGAPLYAAEDFTKQLSSFLQAKDALAREEERFILFRNYEKVTAQYQALIAEGELLLGRVSDVKKCRAAEIEKKILAAREQMILLRGITTTMNEGRLSRRSLMKAEIALDDARREVVRENFDIAERRINDAQAMNRAAEKILGNTICRYLDNRQIQHWRHSADAVIAESRRTGGYALVVEKLDRKLTVYRGGKELYTYNVGLGLNGLSDKTYSGDKATPEGRYQIVRRVPNSAYYRALLINYPNDEDRRQFQKAKSCGQVPRGRGLGGNVEIHGGGKDGVTEGCISLDNPEMQRLYDLIGPGTPIVIVGALTENSLFAPVCRTRR